MAYTGNPFGHRGFIEFMRSVKLKELTQKKFEEEKENEMNKFTRGMSYIVAGGNKRRFIVHQTGLKSWRATLFTHVVTDEKQWDINRYGGNATTLYDRLERECKKSGEKFEVRAYNTDTGLRKDMFDILIYGYFKD